MKKKQKDYGLIFWLHMVVNLILIFSWVLFSWWIIVIGEIILRLQYWIFGGCILSKAEFGIDEACIPYYLEKWGIAKNNVKSRRLVRDYLPIIVIVLALIWQMLLGFKPLIF